VPKKADEKSSEAQQARENFEKNLQEEGLQLEFDREVGRQAKYWS